MLLSTSVTMSTPASQSAMFVRPCQCWSKRSDDDLTGLKDAETSRNTLGTFQTFGKGKAREKAWTSFDLY